MIKALRRVGAVIGNVLDAEDRRVIGQALVLAGGFAFAVLTIAGSTGFAVRLFEIARG